MRAVWAWRITVLSAVNSALYYCELAWVVPLLHGDGGHNAAASGVMLTVMISIQVVAMLAVPARCSASTGTNVLASRSR